MISEMGPKLAATTCAALLLTRDAVSSSSAQIRQRETDFAGAQREVTHVPCPRID